MEFSEKNLIIFRPFELADEAFIFTTWLNGLYFGSDSVKKFYDAIEITKDQFFKKYHKVIEIILDCPSVNINVACLKEDPDVILGYSVTDTIHNEPTLHYVFVKSAWRKMGLAKELIPKDIIRCTHLTKVGRAIKPKEWTYSPFYT